MSLMKQLPTAATLANAAAGFMACGLTVAGRPELAALAILVAVLMDSLDGALARYLEVESDLGAQLDSLSDIVSFGVAPALLAGSLLPGNEGILVWALMAVFPLCAAWRLARFNVAHNEDAGEHGLFLGLPTTGAGGAAATLALLYIRFSPQTPQAVGPILLTCTMALLGVLMVSKFNYRHGGAVIARLNPGVALVLAVLFVVGSALWDYEYLFGVLMWSYVLSAPLLTATKHITAVHHA
jgi:CDP-diacylglycerol--serine O-phosphatidyltransferase